MLNFKGRIYPNPREVTMHAKELRKKRLFHEARELLQAAIYIWPTNIFLYNQLLSCTKNPIQVWSIFQDMAKAGVKANKVTYTSLIDAFGKAGQLDKVWSIFQDMAKAGVKANEVTYTSLIDAFGKVRQLDKVWSIFQDMAKAGVKADAFTYTSLINVFYSSNRQKEILEALDPKELPMDSLSIYSDALRKDKQYSSAVELCNLVLSQSQNIPTKEYAWIVRLYCFLHTNKKSFIENIDRPMIDASSLHYPRFLAAKVFGKAYEPHEKDGIRKKLEEFLSEKRNDASTKDIACAISILSE